MFDVLQLDPLEVGNFGTLAAFENDQEEKVDRLVAFFQKFDEVEVSDLEDGFETFGVDYPNLPQFLKDKIDKINVI